MDYRTFPQGYALRIDPGEEVVETLTRFVKEKDIKLGVVSALGAANDITVGIFETDKKEYSTVRCQGDFEITALVGNVTRQDGEPYFHLHIAIANPVKGEIHGGHLSRCVISLTLELFLQVWDGEIGRRFSDEVGLNLLDFQ